VDLLFVEALLVGALLVGALLVGLLFVGLLRCDTPQMIAVTQIMIIIPFSSPSPPINLLQKGRHDERH
jgi:hypothetical protein